MNLKTSSRLIALCLIAVFVSCRKETYKPAEVEKPAETPFSGTIESVDLKTIHFVPSPNPLYFNSIAIGREVGGVAPKISLSGSGWTHPSMLFFENGWNGFKYWAALTPYPDTDSQYENPHIFCSTNGIAWSEPKGIVNPIEPCPGDKGFNSDVNLMMNKNVMYCYWRATETKERSIYVRKSSDGIHWTEKELVCEMPYNVVDVISPAFLKGDDNYYCYAVCGVEDRPGNYYNKYSIRRMVSSDPVHFTPAKDQGFDLVKIEGRPWSDTQEPWHLEVRKLKNIWMMLVTTSNLNAFGSGGRLFMGYSKDGLNFKFENSPICNLTGSTYKSSFNAKINAKDRSIDVQLWRATMGYGWAVFPENFAIKIN